MAGLMAAGADVLADAGIADVVGGVSDVLSGAVLAAGGGAVEVLLAGAGLAEGAGGGIWGMVTPTGPPEPGLCSGGGGPRAPPGFGGAGDPVRGAW